jgi:hypothetical protein
VHGSPSVVHLTIETREQTRSSLVSEIVNLTVADTDRDQPSPSPNINWAGDTMNDQAHNQTGTALCLPALSSL